MLLGFLNANLRQDLLRLSLAVSVTPGPLAVLLVAALGLGLSLLGVFWQREKSVPEKAAMLVFAVVLTAGTGLYAGWIVLRTSRGWLMIFPLWNMIHAGLLLVLLRLGVANPDCIVDEHATFAQVVLTAGCAAVLLAICQYFELHWAVTFSVTVAYVMSLHNALRDVFGGRRRADLGTRR